MNVTHDIWLGADGSFLQWMYGGHDGHVFIYRTDEKLGPGTLKRRFMEMVREVLGEVP